MQTAEREDPSEVHKLAGRENEMGGNRQPGSSQKLRSHKCLLPYAIVVTLLALVLLIVVIVLSLRGASCSTAQQMITPDHCPDGWITYKRKCYYLSVRAESWENSQRFCVDSNSTLAIIDNNEEYELLNSWIEGNSRWIGLNSTDGGSKWFWSDGKQYTEDFLRIGKGTNPGDKQFVYLSKDSVKSEIDGSLRKKCFCKKELSDQPA